MDRMTQLREMRERTGLGMYTCQEILRGRDLMRRTLAATTVSQLSVILMEVIQDQYPQEPT